MENYEAPGHTPDEIDNISKAREVVTSWVESPEYPSSLVISEIHKSLLEGITSYQSKGIIPLPPGVPRNTDLILDRNESNLYVRSGDVKPLMSAYCRKLDEILASLPARPHGKIAAISNHAAWAYYVFIRIHPFYDGNGRTGRAILNRVLLGGGIDDIMFLSDWFINERDIHIDAMEAVVHTGDLSYLELYLLNTLKLNYTQKEPELKAEIDQIISAKTQQKNDSKTKDLEEIWDGFQGVDIYRPNQAPAMAISL